MKINQTKGITLIALIITVIVMLILVGVVLTISIGDNGLVNRAKTATEQTEIAADKELLLAAVIGTIGNDGTVNLENLVLPEGFTGSNGTYTSPNGYTFTVSENGDVEYTGGTGSEEKETVDLNGRYYSDMSDEGYWEFSNSNTLTIVDEYSNNTYNLSQWDVDTVNKTFTITVDIIEDRNTMEVIPQTITFNYELIEENGVIVNKTLYVEGEGILFFQNAEGLEDEVVGNHLNHL